MFSRLGFAAFAAFFSVSTASAITIDGNLADWGVTPFQDMQADIGNTLDHREIFDPQSMKWGDDNKYDIELGAIYANNSGVHIAMILSDPNIWEDLAININGSKNYQFGVDLSGIGGGGSLSIQQRNVYNVLNWQTSIHGYTFLDNPFQVLEGQLLGTATFAFNYLGEVEHNDSIWGHSYIIEGYIPWDILGIARPDRVGFHFAEISCLRDAIKVDTEVVPEPASILLLGSALVGLGHRRRKLLKSK